LVIWKSPRSITTSWRKNW